MPLLRMLVWLPLVFSASAQTFQQTWQTLHAKNPVAAPALRIHGARFHEGELIPFALDSAPRDSNPDRMYQFGGFLLTPAAECGTLTRTCFELVPRNGPGAYSPIVYGELNGYVRSLRTGTYRVAAIYVLEVLKAGSPMGRTFGYTEPREYLVSNAAWFEIAPASPAWQRTAIAAAVKTLIEGDAHEPFQMRQAAAHQLRAIQTPAAWQAELDQLEHNEYELTAGLESASDKKTVCAMMRDRLAEPRQFISLNYLDALGRVCATPTDIAASGLAAHVGGKLPAMRTPALEALIQYAAARPAPPAWLPAVRLEVIREFPSMPEQHETQFLEGERWPLIRTPEMAPALEAVLDKLGAGYYELWRLAIRRLNELAPVRAQARILAEMLRPAGHVDDATLALLPVEATRDLTPKLIDALAAAQRGNGGDYRFDMSLLARYADARALPRIKAIFESQTDGCQPELLTYFLRVDPAYADAVLHRQPWDMHAPAPECTARYFAVTARLYMSPPLEKFMAAYLMHGDVHIKMMAAESLGKYGTAAAEAPLWDTLRYFHEWWKDRRDQLKQNPEGEFLEVALRNAIARGNGWLVSEAELRMIDSLCISERCQYETGNDLQNLRQRFDVEVQGDRYRVAQYFNLDSLPALEKKLSQFPAGTTFNLRVWGPDRVPVFERLQRFGAGKGLAFHLTS